MNHAMPTNFYAKSIYELVIYLKFYQDGSKKKKEMIAERIFRCIGEEWKNRELINE